MATRQQKQYPQDEPTKTGIPEKSEGYDVGLCGPGQFYALHVVASDQDVTIQFVSPGPNRMVKMDPPKVLKFVREDAAGRHYVIDEGKDGKYELVLKFDKDTVDGMYYANDEKVAKFYGAKAADESNLKATAFILFQMCQQMNEAPDASKS